MFEYRLRFGPQYPNRRQTYSKQRSKTDAFDGPISPNSSQDNDEEYIPGRETKMKIQKKKQRKKSM